MRGITDLVAREGNKTGDGFKTFRKGAQCRLFPTPRNAVSESGSDDFWWRTRAVWACP
jgi:hypothetical protein